MVWQASLDSERIEKILNFKGFLSGVLVVYPVYSGRRSEWDISLLIFSAHSSANEHANGVKVQAIERNTSRYWLPTSILNLVRGMNAARERRSVKRILLMVPRWLQISTVNPTRDTGHSVLPGGRIWPLKRASLLSSRPTTLKVLVEGCYSHIHRPSLSSPSVGYTCSSGTSTSEWATGRLWIRQPQRMFFAASTGTVLVVSPSR